MTAADPDPGAPGAPVGRDLLGRVANEWAGLALSEADLDALTGAYAGWSRAFRAAPAGEALRGVEPPPRPLPPAQALPRAATASQPA